MSTPTVYGEVIVADTQLLEVECHALYAAPRFGSFVRADCVGSGVAHYGVVTHVATAPFDGTRVVQAHRLPPSELEQRKPHLTTLFRTTFRARLVGYGLDGMRISGTAPTPPRLHCFVCAAAAEEVRGITGSPAFLRPLTQAVDTPVEDLLVSAITSAREAWGAQAPVVAWAKYLARLLGRDYVALESVVQRLQPPMAPAVSPQAAPPRVTSRSVQARAVASLEQERTLLPNGEGRRPLGPNDDPFLDD